MVYKGVLPVARPPHDNLKGSRKKKKKNETFCKILLASANYCMVPSLFVDYPERTARRALSFLFCVEEGEEEDIFGGCNFFFEKFVCGSK
jgi:hypothetical protein